MIARLASANTIVLGIALLLCGCTTAQNAHFGIRPPAPTFQQGDSACTQFEDLVNYSQNLQEAYHSRATQNRWWIYVGGTVALGTAAATGGLGAAGAAGLTIALLGISGGFTGGFFALIDNSTLAAVYTVSANQVNDAINKAYGQLQYDASAKLNPSSCENALDTLDSEVTAAKDLLERARTDSAVAALIRAKAEVQELNKLLTPQPSATSTPSPTPTP